ncbi:MAG: ABC transporter permease, partial [Bacteroidota bacterium]
MLRNYLLVAFRALRRQPGYAAINVGGLGLGLACCFMIVLFIQHERSFDMYHANGDRVYRLTVNERDSDNLRATTPAGLAPLVEGNVVGVEHAIRYGSLGQSYVDVGGDAPRRLDRFYLTDPGFFEAFSFTFVAGDPATALLEPNNLVVTETQARTLFGDAEAVGQVVSLYDNPLTITGVIEDLPTNTHLAFSALGSFQFLAGTNGPEALEDFSNWNYRTYVLTETGASAERVSQAATSFLAERFEEPETVADLQALASLRFDTQMPDYSMPTRNPQVLWVFGGIAALILLIACVNFTNLATARATQRAREIGVRKSLGAGRRQLVVQFLGESVLLSVIAIGVGVLGAAIGLPFFNDALGGATAINLGHPATLAALMGIGLVAGLLAGTYPAVYLTRFDPSRVLKGDLTAAGGAPAFRKGLVVAQFAISTFLLVATLTVMNQLQYMRSQDLGFAKEHVITFNPTSDIWAQFDSFEQALLDNPAIASVASASGLPGTVGMSRGFYWPGGEAEEEAQSLTTLIGGPDYLETVGLEMAEGRWFRDSEADMENAYILNETAVRPRE